MRLLHVSDWHVGLTPGPHARRPDHERVFGEIVAAVRDVKPDLVLHTGDVFSRKLSGRRLRHGCLKTKGIKQLLADDRESFLENPFLPTPIGGRFNFDPCGAWTRIDAGYSPNDQKHLVEASCTVEFLAAWGLENARPLELEKRQVRYAVWGTPLTPPLARVALCGGLPSLAMRWFHFTLALNGKQKIVTFAEEDPME